MPAIDAHTEATEPQPLAAEMPALRTYYRDAETAFLERFSERHPITDTERLAWEREHPAALEDSSAFETAFAARYQSRPERDVVGFYDPVERQAHVQVEHNDDIISTIGHEHVHGLIPPEAANMMPASIIEGQTEAYAREIIGVEPELGDLAAYQSEVEQARLAARFVGVETIDNAFLQGDVASFKTAVERALTKRSEKKP